MVGALRTPRLLLRPSRDEDIAAFLEMSADPLVMEYLPPADEGWVARAHAHWDEHGFGQWVVELPGTAGRVFQAAGVAVPPTVQQVD